MNKTSVAAALGGASLIFVFAPQAASAQAWPTGAELNGQSISVERGGVVNTVYFDPGGMARITSDTGREVQGRWFVENQTLCLQLATGDRECWPYQAAFPAGQPVSLTSSCGPSTWTWLAAAPMPPPPPPPEPTFERGGERG